MTAKEQEGGFVAALLKQMGISWSKRQRRVGRAPARWLTLPTSCVGRAGDQDAH